MNLQMEDLMYQSGLTAQGCWDEMDEYDRAAIEKFAELIVRECVALCEQVAADANEMADSKFVTDAGRMLHEGMWGGAKNCGAEIRGHFLKLSNDLL